MSPRRLLAVVVLALPLLVLACQEYELAQAEAEIIVDPDELDFGYVTTGAVESLTFRIKNIGDKTVQITGFSFEVEQAFLGIDKPLDEAFTLGQKQKEPVEVRFSPTDDLEPTTNVIYVHHDASEEPLTVDIGMAAGAEPDIVVDPNPVAFGAVNSNQTITQQVLVSNVGEGVLLIDDLTLDGDAEFSLDANGIVGSGIASGDSAAFDVAFNAGGATGSFEGAITLTSNDPDDNPLVVPVTAGSGVPVAYCRASPEEVYAIQESSTFFANDGTGNESGDPNYPSNQLTYNWSWVSKPQGSAVHLNGNAPERVVWPDMAGTYTAQLSVCNPLEECSAPCQASFEAIVPDNLWVEMSWTNAPDDFDLHLVRPGGQYWSNSDCYFSNCQQNNVSHFLDWGQPGNYADDPSLDLDDIPGTGPENINVDAPENGTFTIIVHDYEGSNGFGADFMGSNQVTINIYTNGGLEYTETLYISGDDSVTQVAACTFPGGGCTPL